MEVISIAEAMTRFKAQGVEQNDYAAICPICGTVQSMGSLVLAGAKKDEVDRFFAFSCEGRFNLAGPWPRDAAQQQARTLRGCNWTLGGLFQLHKFEIEYEDGRRRPCFEIATPTQAQELTNSLVASA